MTPPTERVRTRAVEYLKAAIRYPSNPVVRVEAVEAIESLDSPDRLPWLRSALLDDHPAVRFAACVALGNAKDAGAADGIARALDDPDDNVRVGALFARHRLGRTERTGELAGLLLNHKEASVRRNAALVLGLLGEPGGIKVLAKAMRDADPGVRHHALEAMARLGNREARQELTFMTNAGVGSDEVIALNALASTLDPSYLETYRYKLSTATHLETRLAAARGLGLLQYDDGFEIALEALRATAARTPAGDMPGDEPVLRRRQLAAAALGAMGCRDALPALERTLETTDDPRLQVSAARAIVDIARDPRTIGAFASSKDPRQR